MMRGLLTTKLSNILIKFGKARPYCRSAEPESLGVRPDSSLMSLNLKITDIRDEIATLLSLKTGSF